MAQPIYLKRHRWWKAGQGGIVTDGGDANPTPTWLAVHPDCIRVSRESSSRGRSGKRWWLTIVLGDSVEEWECSGFTIPDEWKVGTFEAPATDEEITKVVEHEVDATSLPTVFGEIETIYDLVKTASERIERADARDEYEDEVHKAADLLGKLSRGEHVPLMGTPRGTSSASGEVNAARSTVEERVSDLVKWLDSGGGFLVGSDSPSAITKGKLIDLIADVKHWLAVTK